MSVNRVSSRTFGRKREEVFGEGNHIAIRFIFCILYHLCYYKPHKIKNNVKKGTRIHIVELRNAYKVLIENKTGYQRRREVNIKTEAKLIGCEHNS
jgi:hypothetical protein